MNNLKQMHSSACKQGAAHPGSTSERRLLRHTHASSHFCEQASKSDMGEKKLLNKVFFVHKKYSRSFITLRLNHWCHMDYFNNVLTTFLGLDVSVTLLSMQGQKALGFHQIYLNSCSDDERMSYGFGTTWGWVINDRIFIFGWTIP